MMKVIKTCEEDVFENLFWAKSKGYVTTDENGAALEKRAGLIIIMIIGTFKFSRHHD